MLFREILFKLRRLIYVLLKGIDLNFRGGRSKYNIACFRKLKDLNFVSVNKVEARVSLFCVCVCMFSQRSR